MASAIAARKRAALIGALVGDAASLGLHWNYSPARIAELGEKDGIVLFRVPSDADYAGGVGYFAHGGKQAGDFTQYGEHLLSALRATAAADGRRWNSLAFLNDFASTFGRGGRFNGYIDGATNATLDNRASRNALAAAAGAAVAAVDKSVPRTDEVIEFVTKNLGAKAASLPQGDAFPEAFAAFVKGELKSADAAAFAAAAAKTFDRSAAVRSGKEGDAQINAFVKLPAVIAAHAADDNFDAVIAEAIRTTNDSDEAVQWGLLASRLVRSAIVSGDSFSLDAAVKDALAGASEPVQKLVAKALAFEKKTDPAALAEAFQMPCPMEYCVPLSLAIATVPGITLRQALDINVRAAGDNAGRAMFLGALLGAQHGVATEAGVPLAWIGRLNKGEEATRLIDTLTA